MLPDPTPLLRQYVVGSVTQPDDPIVARRRLIGRWAGLGQRVGYLLFGCAVVLFLVAMATNLPRGLVTAVVVCLAVGSALLAPSIVVGYGVRAAEREDSAQQQRR